MIRVTAPSLAITAALACSPAVDSTEPPMTTGGGGSDGVPTRYESGPSPDWKWVSVATSSSRSEATDLIACDDIVYASSKTEPGTTFAPGAHIGFEVDGLAALTAYRAQTLSWVLPIVGDLAKLDATVALEDCSVLAAISTSDSEVTVGETTASSNTRAFIAHVDTAGSVSWLVPTDHPITAFARTDTTVVAVSSDDDTGDAHWLNVDANTGATASTTTFGTMTQGNVIVTRLLAMSNGDVAAVGTYNDVFPNQNDILILNPGASATELTPLAPDGDAFVAWADTAGQVQWAATWGTDWSSTLVHTAARDDEDNITVAGRTRHGHKALSTGFVAHFDAAREELAWVRQVASPEDADVRALTWHDDLLIGAAHFPPASEITLDTGLADEHYARDSPPTSGAILFGYDRDGQLVFDRVFPSLHTRTLTALGGELVAGGSYGASATFGESSVPVPTFEVRHLFVGGLTY